MGGILTLNLISGALNTELFIPSLQNHNFCCCSLCGHWGSVEPFDESYKERGYEITRYVLVNVESKQSTDSFPECKQEKENVASDPMLHWNLSLQTLQS